MYVTKGYWMAIFAHYFGPYISAHLTISGFKLAEI